MRRLGTNWTLSALLFGGALALGQACAKQPPHPARLGDFDGGGGYVVGGGGTSARDAAADAPSDVRADVPPEGGGAQDAAADGPAHCRDGVKDLDESDVDCGGLDCAPCAAGKTCGLDSDCASRRCNSAMGVCAAPTCTDSVQNGNETDVDCGGSCPACATGQHCAQPADCQSGACTNGTCQ